MNQNVDKLPQDAKDIIQAIFDYSVPASCGFPPDAIEVKLNDPVNNLYYGNDGVHFHALGNIEHYLNHRNNDEWAIVFDGSPIGNKEHGKTLINSGKEIII